MNSHFFTAQVVQPLSFQMTEILPWIATLITFGFNWRLSNIAMQAKLDIKEATDGVRTEQKAANEKLREDLMRQLTDLRTDFVPSGVDHAQRTAIERRVELIEIEVNKSRERNHELANKFSEMLMGPLQKINDQLTDKARRMSAYEERERVISDRLRDCEDAVKEAHISKQRHQS